MEKPARLSALSVAATQIRLAAVLLHGYVGAVSLSVPSLPAATTNSVFGWSVMASEIACEQGPPSDALTTFAPLAAAYVNASAMLALLPEPFGVERADRHDDACHATPVMPMPLLPRAAIVPATCVPWSS